MCSLTNKKLCPQLEDTPEHFSSLVQLPSFSTPVWTEEMLECVYLCMSLFSQMKLRHISATSGNIKWFELLSLSRDDDVRRSGAGGPHVHLFGELKHKDDVGPLVWVRVDAHAHQAPQLTQKVD